MSRIVLFAVAVCLCASGDVVAQKRDQPIPHGQQQPPGPALNPQQAIAKMTVPEGFSVEVVASEPDIVNPVAMTFDEQGRIWITESLEYPRSSAGTGRDRVKVLEDTDHDGVADKFTIFADGLNIPSGIAVGHGGVWVANAPDILFLQDTDGDGKADRREVVVTGFGRTDTHELPNSLTWGPDGWLYGLNGVFNYSHVKTDDGDFRFTCALFRIHPRTRKFELFAEGTSNPWGIAWNPVGDAFLSACVIDHLWHLTESGYYHRQGGPYPPFTWKLESIVDHKHQKAAYCGIHYFDSDAYPAEYRDRLYMGNIHGNCLNVDVLQDKGATYFATGRPDFLSANDAWFMPVAQKTGPDGCLYVLDWYDRYHCYQDARRDPEGIDRLKGRLYRIRYQDTPRATAFNLNTESDSQLADRLGSANVYFRDAAQRVLSERASADAVPLLERIVLDDQKPLKTRMHAVWSLIGAGPLRSEFLATLLQHDNPHLRAWAVRAAGNQAIDDDRLTELVAARRFDSHARVRLQVAIAADKLEGLPTISTLVDVLSVSGDDSIIPQIVWQNLHPLLESGADEFVAAAAKVADKEKAAVYSLLPRVIERVLAAPDSDPEQTAALVRLVLSDSGSAANSETAARCLKLISQRVSTGELSPDAGQKLVSFLDTELKPLLKADSDPSDLQLSAVELATSIGDKEAIVTAQSLFGSHNNFAVRLRMLRALVTANADGVPGLAKQALSDGNSRPDDLRQVIQTVADYDSPAVADVLLSALPGLPESVQPVVVEALTGRVDWGTRLMQEIAAKRLAAGSLNVNQARKLNSLGSKELSELVASHWGTIRTERDPQRAELIKQMRQLLSSQSGDPEKGQAVFKKVCGQCHKIYGEGAEVGPDITRNGRSSYEQLLSNVFDPSLVIGAAYQAVTVVTTEGKVVTGLPIEDNDQRIVLRIQGDKTETIPRANIEESAVSKLSLMPEGLEKQLKPEELIDLFAFLTRTAPASAPNAGRIPGSPR